MAPTQEIPIKKTENVSEILPQENNQTGDVDDETDTDMDNNGNDEMESVVLFAG